jgi:hypothetical protein
VTGNTSITLWKPRVLWPLVAHTTDVISQILDWTWLRLIVEPSFEDLKPSNLLEVATKITDCIMDSVVYHAIYCKAPPTFGAKSAKEVEWNMISNYVSTSPCRPTTHHECVNHTTYVPLKVFYAPGVFPTTWSSNWTYRWWAIPRRHECTIWMYNQEMSDYWVTSDRKPRPDKMMQTTHWP